MSATTSIITTAATGGNAATTHAASTTAPVIPTGLSSMTSSISAPSESQGYSAQMSAWIASVVDTIRGWLAKLPCIGYCFERSSTPPLSSSQTQSNSVPSTALPAWTDFERFQMIRGQFVAGPATDPVPIGDVVDYTLAQFRLIESPFYKVKAFEAILRATNSSDNIARSFYDALPEGTLSHTELEAGRREASKTSFRYQAWLENGDPAIHPRIGSSVYETVDHGANFGQYIIDRAIRDPLAKRAAHSLKESLRPPHPVSSSTGAPATAL